MTGTTYNIGIACFHFSPRSVEVPAKWPDAIKSALESVASIDDVQITGLGRFASLFDPDGESEGLDGHLAYDFEMHPQIGTIAFTVKIPVRDQEKLNLFRNGAIAPNEQFRVVTRYGTQGPATVVQFSGYPDSRPVGSQGVVVVREFLEREFKRADAAVDFLVVGPSPFHADVAVSVVEDGQVDGIEQKYVIEGARSRGYESLEIACAEGSFNELIEKLMFEAQFFYGCVREQGRNRFRAEVVSVMAEELIGLYRGEGVRNIMRRLLRSGAQARELLIAVIQAKLAEARSTAELANDFNEYVDSKKISLFETKISEEVTSTISDQLKSSEEVAKLLEGGAKKEFEVFVLSTSTLLGAAAGAVAALLSK